MGLLHITGLSIYSPRKPKPRPTGECNSVCQFGFSDRWRLPVSACQICFCGAKVRSSHYIQGPWWIAFRLVITFRLTTFRVPYVFPPAQKRHTHTHTKRKRTLTWPQLTSNLKTSPQKEARLKLATEKVILKTIEVRLTKNPWVFTGKPSGRRRPAPGLERAKASWKGRPLSRSSERPWTSPPLWPRGLKSGNQIKNQTQIPEGPNRRSLS